MKARLIRDDLPAMPGGQGSVDGIPAADLVGEKLDTLTHLRAGVRCWLQNVTIEHPDAFRLVQYGCALPADEECATRARMSSSQLAAAKHAYERVNAGIAPEDYTLFDAGIITGYESDGSYKPGPNWHLRPEAQKEDEDDE